MKSVLVVKGALIADDLQSFGLPMARRFAQADTVIGIDRDGHARAIKSRELFDVSFIDGESSLGEFATVLSEIKDEYERLADPKDRHFAHAYVGLWIFYWMGHGKAIAPLPIEMAGRGDIAQLRASARAFIEADFGRKLPGSDKIPVDGEADPAGT